MRMNENNGEQKGPLYGMLCSGPFAGLDGTYDFLLVAPVFLHPAEKDAKNPT